MSDFVIQPMSIYIGLALMGIFNGLGATIGGVIAKLWVEPRLENLNRNFNNHQDKEDEK